MEAANVRAVRYTTTGACGVGRSRIVGIVLTTTGGAGGGRITITEGNGGATKLDLDFNQNVTQDVIIPGDGILCASDPYISVASNIVAVTIFFV